jgi:5-formyltetrahydrofolate cyclo-ligase
MTKAEIRTEYIQKRRQLSEDLYYELSQKIADQFFLNFHTNLLNINSIHLYLPIEKNKEPNTNFILKTLFQRFKKIKIIVPVANFETNEMSHHEVNEGTFYEENKYGIPEPLNENNVAVDSIDCVLLPLLTFDKKGNRIGYGGGYYDRFLSEVRPDCLKIGLSFFEPTEVEFNIETTDIPLDFCITPNNIWSFSNQNS